MCLCYCNLKAILSAEGELFIKIVLRLYEEKNRPKPNTFQRIKSQCISINLALQV